MNDSRRLANVFMAIGLALAVAVGVVVWKMSSPESPTEPAHQADGVDSTTGATVSRMEETSSQEAENSVAASAAAQPGAESTVPSSRPDNGAQGNERDPLLPPNAVLGTAPRAVTPTQIYRPTNVVPTSVTATPGDAARADSTAAGGAAQTGEPEPSVAQTTSGEPTPTSTPGSPASQPATEASTPAPTNSQAADPTGNTPADDLQNLLAPVTPLPATQPPAEELPAPVQPPAQQQPAPVEQGVPTSVNPADWWERMRQFFS